MPLSLLNPEIIRQMFRSDFYERGLVYYHQNRVHDMKISYDKKIDVIRAIVKGEKPTPYQVKIHIQGSINKLYVQGSCSCPMQTNCKHVVATLLKALDQNPASALIPSPKTPSSYDPKIHSWLKNLNEVLTQKDDDEDTVDKTYSLRYILSKPSHKPTELQLALVLARQLKAGGLGSAKAFNKNLYSHEKHLFPIDKELLTKLSVAEKLSPASYYSDFLLYGPLFDKLIPELLATHRCHWLSLTNPTLTLGPKKSAKFNWKTDTQGFQELKLNFCDSEENFDIFLIEQAWYLNKKSHTFGVLETGLENRIIKVLLSAPKIPPESTEDVANVLDDNIELTEIPAPQQFTETKTKKLTPKFILRLSQELITVRGDYKQDRKLIKVNKPIASLFFDYQGIKIPWGEKNDVIREADDEQSVKQIRNKKIENGAVKELIKYGAALISNIQEISAFSENTKFLHQFLIGHRQQNPLEFSAYALPQLRAAGWEIDIDPNYSYQMVDEPIDDWYSSIDESPSYDWFNLELGITLKGQKINLLPVLQQLLAQMPFRDNPEIAAEPILAQLPDGRFIPLPRERIQNILNILIELYDSESLTAENILRLSKLHAARLLELEAAIGASQLRWLGGERLRKLAEKLTNFSGIIPVKVPKQFEGQLRPYQQEGLNWLQFLREYEFGGILADDMGLGKTIQALAHIATEKECGRMKCPSLIVAPTSLMFNWRMEAERFTPALKVLVLHGSDRKNQFDTISDFDLVLTTYPLIMHDKEILLKQQFYFLILDEAQFVKNSKSLSAQIVQQIRAKHRLCLTGTPLENHLGELWSLFNFLMPGLLGEEKIFNRLFRIPIEKQGNQERREHLVRRVAPFLLRRTKNNVVKELPEKVNMLQQVELDEAQRDLYETIRVTLQEKVSQEIAKLGLARSHIIILDALLKLRQVCCDPRLLKINTAQKNQAKSAKLELLMTLLPELIEEGRHILLFSQFTEMLELIEEELIQQKLSYVKLTGQTKDRATPVQKFQAGEVPLFLISLKAGGTGLNLTTADTVIHYDPWWNPAVEDQATDRAHRIGQTKTVFVYKLVSKGTVEERILEMQQNKRALMEGLFSGSTATKLALTENDLRGLFDPLDKLL